LAEKSLGPGSPTRTGKLLREFGDIKAMPAEMIKLKAARGTLCLALETLAVGGNSKSGATTITSKTAINSKPTTSAQRFIATTRDNFMFLGMSFVKYREAGQPACLCRWPPLTPDDTDGNTVRAPARIERGGDFTLRLRSCLGPSVRRREQSSRRSRTSGVALFPLAHTSIPRDADWPHFESGPPVIDSTQYLACLLLIYLRVERVEGERALHGITRRPGF
jgi:hypothetical protein